LVAAIKAVRVGEPVVDQAAAFKILTRLVSTDETSRQAVLDELHNRELEVLKLAAKGMTNKEIAQELKISERTVQTHFINIFRKLNVGSRTEAVLRALKEGWLPFEDLP
jgi:DNA-binding NarL/FixJ family response regulator